MMSSKQFMGLGGILTPSLPAPSCAHEWLWKQAKSFGLHMTMQEEVERTTDRYFKG